MVPKDNIYKNEPRMRKFKSDHFSFSQGHNTSSEGKQYSVSSAC